MKIKNKLYAVLIIAICSFMLPILACAEHDNLKISKKQGKDFVILQLADMQISDFETLKSSLAQLKQTVADVKPDLLVLTGDNTEGEQSLNMAKKLTRFLESLKVKYAVTFGNHDDTNCTLYELAKVYKSGKNCLFKTSPDEV